MGMLCSTVVNLAKSAWGKKGSYKPTKPEDFIPRWDAWSDRLMKQPTPKGQAKPEQTVSEMKAAIMAIAKTFGTGRPSVDPRKRAMMEAKAKAEMQQQQDGKDT